LKNLSASSQFGSALTIKGWLRVLGWLRVGCLPEAQAGPVARFQVAKGFGGGTPAGDVESEVDKPVKA